MSCCANLRDWRPGLGFLPVLFVLLVTCTIIITYTISVENGHVYPAFPTISETGGRKPERNVFSLLLGLASFLSFMVAFLKYFQFQFHCEQEETTRYSVVCFNKIGLLLGIIASIGMAIVAAFQERGQSVFVHVAGAAAVYGCGILYCWCQTYLSYRMLQCGMMSFCLAAFRLLVSIFGTVCIVLGGVGWYKSTTAWQANPPAHPYEQWRPDDPGYATHLVFSISEWLCTCSLLCFFASFLLEFNKIKVDFSLTRNDVNVLGYQGSEGRQPSSILV